MGAARPVLSGGTNTIELAGDNTVLENVELTGGSFRCLYLHADGLLVRDSEVHDCPAHGILGADNDSGDATLERVEVHHAGDGDREHSIYVATDEIAHPGSVFRMRHCWVHDATGGNLVKSRAERNEIYYNRLEGNAASYHELELIGPDPGGGSVPPGVREDSDVVGNLLVHRRTDFRSAARVGGDATGESEGRYRFVANTFIGPAEAPSFTVFRAFDRLESIEAVGNLMHRPGGVQVMRDLEAEWTNGARSLSGHANWISAGSDLSTGLTGTLQGADPGLDGAWRPVAGSPLIDVGYGAPLVPRFEPPLDGFAARRRRAAGRRGARHRRLRAARPARPAPAARRRPGHRRAAPAPQRPAAAAHAQGPGAGGEGVAPRAGGRAPGSRAGPPPAPRQAPARARGGAGEADAAPRPPALRALPRDACGPRRRPQGHGPAALQAIMAACPVTCSGWRSPRSTPPSATSRATPARSPSRRPRPATRAPRSSSSPS